jgi:hypothetical protein
VLLPPDSVGAGREILPLIVTVSPLTVKGVNVPLLVLILNVSALTIKFDPPVPLFNSNPLTAPLALIVTPYLPLSPLMEL